MSLHDKKRSLYYSQARLPQVNRPARRDIQAMDLRRREEMSIRLSKILIR